MHHYFVFCLFWQVHQSFRKATRAGVGVRLCMLGHRTMKTSAGRLCVMRAWAGQAGQARKCMGAGGVRNLALV